MQSEAEDGIDKQHLAGKFSSTNGGKKFRIHTG
jgi:hypothetical protein